MTNSATTRLSSRSSIARSTSFPSLDIRATRRHRHCVICSRTEPSWFDSATPLSAYTSTGTQTSRSGSTSSVSERSVDCVIAVVPNHSQEIEWHSRRLGTKMRFVEQVSHARTLRADSSRITASAHRSSDNRSTLEDAFSGLVITHKFSLTDGCINCPQAVRRDRLRELRPVLVDAL